MYKIMGVIWSKFRSKETSKERLEKITEEIRSLEDHKFSAIKQEKNTIFLLFVISGLIYIFSLGIFYFYYLPFNPHWVQRCLYSLPLVVFPFLVYFLKKLLQWYYLQVLDKKEDRLKDLRREKRKILEKVMETETYKVAKELLERYEPSALKESRPSSCPSSPALNLPGYSVVNRKPQQQQQHTRTRYRGSMPPPMINSSFVFNGLQTPERPRAITETSFNSSQGSIPSMSPQPQPGSISMVRPPFPQFPALPPPRLARPILDQNRSIVDKLVDYVVGDGPSNRYALICYLCSGHNGMALKEEFEYISFRCCYCMSLNAARKQRPFAPNISSNEMPQRETNLSPLIDEPESDSETGKKNSQSTPKIAEMEEPGDTLGGENDQRPLATPTISISEAESYENDRDPLSTQKIDDEDNQGKESHPVEMGDSFEGTPNKESADNTTNSMESMEDELTLSSKHQATSENGNSANDNINFIDDESDEK